MVSRKASYGVPLYMRLVRFQRCALVTVLLLVTACCGSRPPHVMTISPITGTVADDSGDRRVLAGDWDYEELATVLLTLDETGHGTYGCKKGHQIGRAHV